jgi:hypothetical protein
MLQESDLNRLLMFQEFAQARMFIGLAEAAHLSQGAPLVKGLI